MRLPSVAGQFYPGDRASLGRLVDECFAEARSRDTTPVGGTPRVGIAPHAGYFYSGSTAAMTVSALNLSLTGSVVLVGPNHTGMGGPYDVSLDDFDTPLGPAMNDKALSKRLVDEGLVRDAGAHAREHSLEVQLPFLLRKSPSARITPVVIGDQSPQSVRKVARAIIASCRNGEALLASSDFTHCGAAYGQPVPPGTTAGEYARKRDAPALERIMAMDPEGFLSIVQRDDLSICGAGPIAMAMMVAKSWGASRGVLLEYTTSYDAYPGPMAVGYASIVFV